MIFLKGRVFHDKCLNRNSIIILQDYKDEYLGACRKMMMMKTLIPASHPRQDTGNTNQLTRQLNIVYGGIINEVICGRQAWIDAKRWRD